MWIPESYRAAKSLQQYLGDPCAEDNPFSFKRVMEMDEREEYPEHICALLNEWGLPDYFVPVAYGGKLDSYEELFSLFRVVAQRDVTVAFTQAVTYVASSVVWIGGDDRQKERVAEIIRSRDQVAIGLHEQAHGNDLLACEVRADKKPNGYALSGEKWVIGNPRRSSTIVIFAKTGLQGSHRGFSLLLLEKKNLPKSGYSYLHKFKTHGLRGHEVSGIRFESCSIPDESVIGPPGSGLEIALKASQVTRVVVTGLCLGALDTALRVTLDFALSRRLYGGAVLGIPHARGLLVDAFLDLLICDCVATVAARGLHVATSQMSVWASIAKYFIPDTTNNVIRQLSVVLGARHYLREGHWWGVFQKIARDCIGASVSHYSSVISLSHLAPQLFHLADHRAKAVREGLPQQSTLNGLFALDQPAPAFAADRLALHNRGRDDVMAGLEAGLREIEELELKGDVERPMLLQLRRLTRRLLGALRAQDRRLLAANGRGQALGQSVEMMEMAKRYSTLYAAAACIQIWLRNRDRLGEFFRKGEWLALGLNRLRRSLGGGDAAGAPEMVDRVAQELERRYRERRAFAIVPLDLAEQNSTCGWLGSPAAPHVL
jgi:alkylation response protein AidB-like acyl-CoA dehydrogenase